MERKSADILKGIRTTDSHLTQLANDITTGYFDKTSTGKLDAIRTTVEETIKDAKIANNAYKRAEGVDIPQHYKHLLQVGKNVVKEIQHLKDQYLEDTLGRQ